MKLKVHYLISGHQANEHLEMPEAWHRQALVFILKKYSGLSTSHLPSVGGARQGVILGRYKVHLIVSKAIKDM